MIKNKDVCDWVRKECFNKFREYISYKGELYGIGLVIGDRFYGWWKSWSECGCIKKDLKVKDRVYRCGDCGVVIDRDYNGWVNLCMYKLG